MSALHPHWHSTDDAPVPVRVVQGTSADAVHKVSAHVSRRPAAVLGIMLAIAIGAVSYGTLDDGNQQLTGAITTDAPASAFDILARQIAQEALEDSMANADPTSPPWEAFSESPDIPEQTVTNNAAQQISNAAIPTNTNTLGSDNESIMHSAAPRPFTQPESGAGMILATLAGAFAMLVLMARNTLKIQI